MSGSLFSPNRRQTTNAILTQLPQATGYEVHTAGTVQTALRDLPLIGGEVLLYDIRLPDGNRWKLLRELRQAAQRSYAIAMSGSGTLAHVAASQEAGYS